MKPSAIHELLERVARGQLSADQATEALKGLPFTDLGFARVDGHRELRSGLPEVVFAEGKTAGQIIEIARTMLATGQAVLVTRLDADKAGELCGSLEGFTYNATARLARNGTVSAAIGTRPASVAVVSAGTADQAVAAEAIETLAFLGAKTREFADVGVAGVHRLLASREALAQSSVAIVVAGMEGALPSVVGGMLDLPLIAVPTSVGYGASFGGLAALLAMMNSCAAGVTVVNIDNGFGAAVAAGAILRPAARLSSSS